MAQAAFAPGSQTAIDYLNRLLAQKNVDVSAADAVFGREGASGGIGDGGHAFGPGQFNNAGGAWTGRYPGMTPEQENAQAWSPSGLAELASRVAAVSAGLKGPSAISNIVSRFERPANPSAEIAGADAAYGSPLAAAASQPAAGQPLAAAGASPLLKAAAPARRATASPILQALQLLRS